MIHVHRNLLHVEGTTPAPCKYAPQVSFQCVTRRSITRNSANAVRVCCPQASDTEVHGDEQRACLSCTTSRGAARPASPAGPRSSPPPGGCPHPSTARSRSPPGDCRPAQHTLVHQCMLCASRQICSHGSITAGSAFHLITTGDTACASSHERVSSSHAQPCGTCLRCTYSLTSQRY